jgi:hypothetical protein
MVFYQHVCAEPGHGTLRRFYFSRGTGLADDVGLPPRFFPKAGGDFLGAPVQQQGKRLSPSSDRTAPMKSTVSGA